jgi:hypothetical protein
MRSRENRSSTLISSSRQGEAAGRYLYDYDIAPIDFSSIQAQRHQRQIEELEQRITQYIEATEATSGLRHNEILESSSARVSRLLSQSPMTLFSGVRISSTWQDYDSAHYGPDVQQATDRHPPKPGVYSEKLDELISKGVISESDIPEDICCMLGKHVMTNPVYFKDIPKYIYDRPFIEHWLLRHTTEPFTRKQVSLTDLASASQLENQIKFFVEQADLKADNKANQFDEAKAQFHVTADEAKAIKSPSM